MNKIGAGIYIPNNPPSQQRVTVDCAVQSGPVNTISRAELAGIWGALQKGQCTIASDSAVSLAQIRRCLLAPMAGGMRYCKHREMIGRTIEVMREMLDASPEIKIRLFKVKAHGGTIGNEIADQVAKKAALGDDSSDLTVSVAPKASYTNDIWPHITISEAGKPARKESLDNLGQSLHAHMHKRHRMGKSNVQSIYYQSWQKIIPKTDTGISNRFINHPAINFGARRITLEWRQGTLWSNKAAHRCGMSNTPLCPLCGQLDGGGHISGGCQHPAMNRMYTARHNSTGRTLLKAISKGNMGADLVMADLGSADKCEQDGAPILTQRRVPASLLSHLKNTKPSELPKSQPDAIIVLKGKNEEKDKVILIEFKYCRDTQPQDQLKHCTTQHDDLIQALRGVYTVKLIPILIGHSGTIFTEHTLSSLKQLGITSVHANKCALKMHLDAVQHLHSIVKTRRHLEHQAPHPPGPAHTKARFKPP